MFVDRPDAAVRHAEAAAAVRRGSMSSISRRFSNNWFGSANYTISRLYGNYAGPGELGRDLDADDRHVARRPRSSRPAASRGRARQPDRAWDLDELDVGFARQPRRAAAASPTDRPVRREVLRRPTGCRSARRSAAFVYAGSGTPMSTVVNTTNTDPGARQRPRRHGPHAGADAAPTCSSRTSSS